MAGTFTNIVYHIVFSTKNRQPLLAPEISPRIYSYLGGAIRDEKGVLYEIGGMQDHIKAELIALLKAHHVDYDPRRSGNRSISQLGRNRRIPFGEARMERR